MSDFHDSQPFSHKWTGIRGSSGGLTLFKAFSEIWHNDRDSQKSNTSGYSYTKSYLDPITKSAYILHWSGSSGIGEIEHLFSLGSTIYKKGADNIGDKNHGHAAAIAFFNPTSMYSETKALTDNKYQSLNFKVKEFDDRVESMNTGEETDYRAISVKDYMTIRRDKSASQHDIITKIKNSIVDTEMKLDLESILDSSKSSYMLHLMEFDKNHLNSNSLIDDEIISLFKSISLYYCDILKENYTIKFEASSKPAKKPITYTANSTTAISPILEPEVHNPIIVTCSMYEHTDRTTNVKETFMKGDIRVQGHNRIFYVENAKSELRKVYPIKYDIKKEWDNAIDKGSFIITLNCPSKKLFEQYYNQLGSDFKKIDDVRGVLMRLYGCYLGMPSWDESMPTKRNAGYLNIDIDMISKDTAKNYFGLKSNKHNSDLSDTHPIIKSFVSKLVNRIVKHYTFCNLSISKSGLGVKTWNTEKIFNQLLGKDTESVADGGNPTPTSDSPSNATTENKNVWGMMGVNMNAENIDVSEDSSYSAHEEDTSSIEESLPSPQSSPPSPKTIPPSPKTTLPSPQPTPKPILSSPQLSSPIPTSQAPKPVPVKELTDEEIVKNAGFTLILTTKSSLDIYNYSNDTKVLLYSINNSNQDDKNSIIKKASKQKIPEKIKECIDEWSKFMKKFET